MTLNVDLNLKIRYFVLSKIEARMYARRNASNFPNINMTFN